MELHTDLGRRLCAAYFPGVSDEHLESSIEQLLSSVRTEHMRFEESALRQALCISVQNPAVPPSSRQRHAGRAIVRLELANGLLFALHLRGNIGPALDRLEQIGRSLALRSFVPDAFDHYDAALSELVNASHAADDRCEIRLARFASVMPLPGIAREMLTGMTFRAFNALRKRYGLHPLNRVPRLLSRHVAAHVDHSAHIVASYVSGLDQDALDVIRHFDSTSRHRYNDLRVYNFFVAEHDNVRQYGHHRHHRQNRIQAVRTLPWLLRVLSGMQPMHPDASSTTRTRGLGDPRVVNALVHAIDSGEPLFHSVARACDVPEETVLWTRGQTLSNRIDCAAPRMDLLLKMLAWVPPEKRPRSNEDWRAMNDVVCTLLPIFPACHDEAAIPEVLMRDARYGDAMARWMRELARPTLAHAARRLDRLRSKGLDPATARDYVDALSRAIRCLHPAVPHDDTLLAWLGARSIYEVLGLSRCWREHPGS